MLVCADRLGVKRPCSACDPILRPEEQEDKDKGRWGDQYRDYWQQEDASHRFKSEEEIKAMVESMVETSKMTGGYMMCIGNTRLSMHIRANAFDPLRPFHSSTVYARMRITQAGTRDLPAGTTNGD